MLVTRLRYLVILDNINQGCNFADHHALGLDLQGLSDLKSEFGLLLMLLMTMIR
jgi:hypothetical protein